MVKEGGVYHVPIFINDSIKLNYVVDSGAADVTLPFDVYRTLQRTGSVSKKDIIGEQKYIMADGNTEISTVVNLKKIQIGNQSIYNVKASVSPHMKGMLLLGQSALQKLEPWSLDTKSHVFYIKENPAESNLKDTLVNVMDDINEAAKKDIDKAVSRCYNGISNRCVNAGVMYKEGKYVTQDYNKAIKFFKIACDDKAYVGCYNLAIMYSSGAGVKRDIGKAVKLYNNSCQNNNAESCYNLAVMYHEGKNVKKNSKKAIKYYKKACDNGISQGCNNLAVLYAKNKKLNKNPLHAYEKGCDGGMVGSCIQLGIIYSEGKKAKQNYYKAAKYYQKACDQKHPGACMLLGGMYDTGGSLKENYSQAKALYKKACYLGEEMGCKFYKGM